jgi:retinol dehydrogenase 12
VLMNNGGVMIYKPDPAHDIERVSPAGLEIQFATTAFGHFYLTQLLLPLLIASAKTSPDKKARVVYVSSLSHLFSPTGEKGPIDYDTVVDGPALKATPTAKLYSQAASVRPACSPLPLFTLPTILYLAST